MPPQNENGIRFDNQGEEFGAPPQQSPGFDLTGKFVQWGLVSNRVQAQYVLITIAVIVVLVAGYIFFGSISGSGAPPPPPVSR